MPEFPTNRIKGSGNNFWLTIAGISVLIGIGWAIWVVIAAKRYEG